MSLSAENHAIAERGRRTLADAEAALHRLEHGDPHAVVDLVNDFLILFSNAHGECNLFCQVHPDPAVRATAEAQLREALRLRNQMLHSPRVFELLGSLEESQLEPLAWRAATLTLRDMRRFGVNLSDAERDRVRSLRDELIELEQAFARNIRDDVRDIQVSGSHALDGLPSDYCASHPPGPDGQVRVTTSYPDYYPFMNYARSEDARVALVHEFYNRAVPSNLQVLRQLLEVRYQVATLLGYSSWADYITEDVMVGSARNAAAFLDRVHQTARASVQAELAQLLEFKQRDRPSATSIGLWESLYYQQLAKAERVSFDGRVVRPYFEYDTVKRAILDLTSELFGLEFTPVAEAAIWHPSVETYEVRWDGESRGRISLDMHPRQGKYGHAACFHWRKGVGGRQLPHVVLVCNFPDPAQQSGPALMDHQEVVTFFHEFGHLVHGLARGNVAWIRLADPERDFMEAPSQLLEEWIFDRDVLQRFARHVDTGEPIPEQHVDALRSGRAFGRALYTQWLLFRSMVSLSFHDRNPHEVDTAQLVFDLADRCLPYQIPSDTHFEASFDHLTGYSAAYYSYLWSQVIAKDLLNGFTEGLLDPVQARRYRDLVLAAGGTKPAANLVSDFLGRPFAFDAFAAWLGATETTAR